ncbi:MAG: BolA family protein, partial [Amphiplicatus sp.]
SPEALDVHNESGLHKGHEGARPKSGMGEGESHFRITIVARAFEGRSRIERQRAINAVLREELAGPLHALAIKALTPDEAEDAPLT